MSAKYVADLQKIAEKLQEIQLAQDELFMYVRTAIPAGRLVKWWHGKDLQTGAVVDVQQKEDKSIVLRVRDIFTSTVSSVQLAEVLPETRFYLSKFHEYVDQQETQQ